MQSRFRGRIDAPGHYAATSAHVKLGVIHLTMCPLVSTIKSFKNMLLGIGEYM